MKSFRNTLNPSEAKHFDEQLAKYKAKFEANPPRMSMPKEPLTPEEKVAERMDEITYYAEQEALKPYRVHKKD